MALTANDIVIFLGNGAPTMPWPPPKGTVIVVGASPEIIWQNTGVRNVYTAIAAPSGVNRTAPSVAADFTNWQHALVEPLPGAGLGNPNGNSRGHVVDVILVGDPPSVLSLVVKCPDGYYFAAAAGMRKVIAP